MQRHNFLADTFVGGGIGLFQPARDHVHLDLGLFQNVTPGLSRPTGMSQ